jgi:hypothetical protein
MVGSSARAVSVPNIVSIYVKNNFVPTKYKVTSKKRSHQATRSNNHQSVTNSVPLTDQDANNIILSHPNLPKGYNSNAIKFTFSLDSKSLRRYIIEDFLFASIGKRLLPLVATSHPSFASHWFHIYEVQAKGHKPLIFGDVLFFQELCKILNANIASTDISLGDDKFNRWLILVGDGLSHVRVANFKDCMEDQ